MRRIEQLGLAGAGAAVVVGAFGLLGYKQHEDQIDRQATVATAQATGIQEPSAQAVSDANHTLTKVSTALDQYMANRDIDGAGNFLTANKAEYTAAKGVIRSGEIFTAQQHQERAQHETFVWDIVSNGSIISFAGGVLYGVGLVASQRRRKLVKEGYTT